LISGAGSSEPFLRSQALHAWKIRFQHPIVENIMELEAPFHSDLRRLVLLLRKHRALKPL
ncbi:MAG: RluA family pseudouridine synthase, partial [Planctomycetes bacterium]|nr:RluA family pseudouridine synthase [Planctomycetota bacterium]